MATFNLTAQLNLKGPTNVKQIAAQIKKDLGTLNANVQFKLDPAASKNVAALSSSLKVLNANFASTVKSANAATSAIKAFGNSVNSVKINNVPQQINQTSSAIAKLNKVSSSTSGGLQNAATEMQEFGKQAGLAVRRFVAFSAVTSVIYGVTNSINNGIQAFIDYDKELVKLQQVTGESASGLSKLQSQISNLAVEFGVSSKELTQVASTLAQAGLSARETEKALKALALSSLAPSFDNMNETVEGSIAIMRQFGISANDLEASLGAVNAVAARFAVESSDIITAVQRTGSVFATASKGVSEGKDALNEFISVFTSIRATSRESAETIATGLRTIFTRVQRGTTIDALKEFGVNLTDAEGKFVGAYKAVELLSKGLGKIDPRSLDFSRIVEELGGFRQIGKVIPLIQQFTVTQQALKVAQQGQASLAKDAATAQLSLANQISKVREEFFSLFREIGQSKGFQSLVRGALSLTSGLIKVADAVKGILPALAVLAAFKGFKALTEFTTGFATGVKRGPDGKANGGVIRKFARGGVVPGTGSGDTVPAMLEPGEFVIRKKAVETIGSNNLHNMNKYGSGGSIRTGRSGNRKKFKAGGKAEKPLIKDISYNYAYDGDSLNVDYTPTEYARTYAQTNPGSTKLYKDKNKKSSYSGSSRLIGIDTPELSGSGSRGGFTDMAKTAHNITESWAEKQSHNSMLEAFQSVNELDFYDRPMFHSPYLVKQLKTEGVAKNFSMKRGSKLPADIFLGRIKYLQKKFPNTEYKNLVDEVNDSEDISWPNARSGKKDIEFFKRYFFGGTVQKFASGGQVSRNIGIIDTDVLRDPANTSVVKKEMEKLGITDVSDYTTRLGEFAAKARKNKSLSKFIAIAGAAGSGKSSLATGKGANDNASLRKTTRSQILTPEDIDKVNEVIVLTSTASQTKLDAYLKDVDRAYILSSNNREEQDRVRSNRESRDITGEGLYGRKPGTTRAANPDFGLEETILRDELGKKATVLGRKKDSFGLRRKRESELPEIIQAGGFYTGGFAPPTRGHSGALYALLDNMLSKNSSASLEDIVVSVAPDLPMIAGKEGIEHAARYGIFPADFRALLSKINFGNAQISTQAQIPGGLPKFMEVTGSGDRRKFAKLKGAMAITSGKDQGVLDKYTRAGIDVKDIPRIEDISATKVRDALFSGDDKVLNDFLDPEVASILMGNRAQLRNRSTMVPMLIEEIQKFVDQDKARSNKEISGLLASAPGGPYGNVSAKLKQNAPEIAGQIQDIRSERDRVSKGAFGYRAFNIIRALSAKYPEIYGLDLSRKSPVSARPSDITREAIAAQLSEQMAGEFGGVPTEMPSGLEEAILKNVEKATQVKKSSGILPAQGSEILKRFGTERLPNDSSFGPFSGKTVRDTADGGKLKYWNSAFRPETKADKLAYYIATRDYLIDKFNESQGTQKATALAETTNAVLSSKQLGLVGLNPLGYTGLLGPETWNLGVDPSGQERSIDASIVQRGLPTQYQNVIDYLSGQTEEIVGGAAKLLGISPKKLTKKQRETLGQGNIEGALLEQIFGSADATILDDALRTRPIDFPMGIGPKAAKIFGIDPNIPTEVKRTIDSGSRAKAVEEFQKYFRQQYGIPDPEKVTAFADGGEVYTPQQLVSLAKYRTGPFPGGGTDSEFINRYLEDNDSFMEYLKTFHADPPKAYDATKNAAKDLLEMFTSQESMSGSKRSGKLYSTVAGGKLKTILTQINNPLNSNKDISDAIGKNFNLNGSLLSTSESPDTASVFQPENGSSAMLSIIRNKNIPSIDVDKAIFDTSTEEDIIKALSKYIDPVSGKSGADFLSRSRSATRIEKEFILPQTSKFRIDDIDRIFSKDQEDKLLGGNIRHIEGMKVQQFKDGGMAFGKENEFEKIRQKILNQYPDINFRISRRKNGFGYNILGGLKQESSNIGNYAEFKQAGNLSKIQEVADNMASSLLYEYGPNIDPSLLKKMQNKRKFANGGSAQDTVPALLTPGEFVVNKKAAEKIGYGKLEKLNKADKIQGYNKGGIVGGVQRFALGGGVDGFLSGLQSIASNLGRTQNITNNRPNSIDTSTIAVDPSILQDTKAFVDTLYDAGDGMKYLNRLLNENKQLSIQAVLEAGNKDLERLKISGASIDKIIEAEKALSNIRNKGLIDVTNRQFLESGFKESSVGKKLGSGATQQKILSLAEKEERRLIDKRKKAIEADIVSSSKQPISPSDLADQVAQAISSELNDIKTQAFSRATAAATGTKTSTGIKGNITESELKNLNITGNDIQKYISDSMRDRKTLRQMDQQLIAMRMEEYKNAGTVRGISVASAEEAKKLAQEEVSKRREAINDLAKMRGERGVGAAGLMDIRNSPINRAFRERYFTGNLGRSMQRGLGDVGLAAGLVAGQGDNIASALFDTKTNKGKIQAADTGARIDKAATTLSVGLTTSAQLAAINPMLGAAAAIGTALYAGADAVYDFSGTAKKAAQEMARALLNDKLSAASDNLSNALEKLSRDANNVELRAKTASAIKSLTDTALESTADTGITGKNKAETERNWSDFGRGILLAVGEIGVGMNPFYQDMDPVTLAKSKQGSYGMEEARVDAQKEIENYQRIANAGYSDLDRLYAKGFTNDQIMDPNNEAGNIVREAIKGMILADPEKLAQYMASGPQGKEAIAGTAAQQAFLANDELAKASQESAKLARAMDLADKAGRRLAASFDKIADIVNESVNKISFESDARVEATAQYASSLRGESTVSGPKLRERNILDNPNAYSEAEFNKALETATAGLDTGTRKQLIGGAQLQQNIPKNITQSIATVLKTSASAGVDEAKKAAIDTAKNEIENNPNLSRQQKDELKQIATAKIENIAKKAKDNNADNSIQLSEFQKELADGTNILGDFGKKLLDSVKALSSFKEGALDKFAKGLNEASKAAKEAENYFRKSREISNEGNMNLREILSGYGETYNEKNNRIMGDVGALAGGQTTVQGIKNRQIMLSGQRDVLQKQQDTLTDPDALRKNVEQLNKLDDQLRDNREALDMLANSTELVDKAFSNLQSTAELQNNRQNFVNQLLTNTPEEADKLNQSFIRLQRNLSGGLNSPYNQRDARKAFNEALFKTGNVREAARAGNTVLANQRKETLALSQDPGVRAAQELQIRNQYAQNRGRPGVDADQAVAEYFQKQQLQLTKQMAIESGMINNPLVQQSLAALEDRKADPAMQQAAERYLEAVGLRANATKAQGELAVIESQSILKNSNDNLRISIDDLRASIEGNLKNANIGMDAAGNNIVNAGVAVPAPPAPAVPKSSGGMVYASSGKLIDFKPKGTDNVPAMLTPGEFVINAKSTAEHLPLLKAINSGNYSKGGVVYLQKGGKAGTNIDEDIDLNKDGTITDEERQIYQRRKELYLTRSFGQMDYRQAYFTRPFGYSKGGPVNYLANGGEVQKRKEERIDAQKESWMMSEAAGRRPDEVVSRTASSWAESQTGYGKWQTMTEEQRQSETKKYEPEFQNRWDNYNNRQADAQRRSANNSGYDSIKEDPNSGIVGVNFYNEEKKRATERFEKASAAETEAPNSQSAQVTKPDMSYTTSVVQPSPSVPLVKAEVVPWGRGTATKIRPTQEAIDEKKKIKSEELRRRSLWLKGSKGRSSEEETEYATLKSNQIKREVGPYTVKPAPTVDIATLPPITSQGGKPDSVDPAMVARINEGYSRPSNEQQAAEQNAAIESGIRQQYTTNKPDPNDPKYQTRYPLKGMVQRIADNRAYQSQQTQQATQFAFGVTPSANKRAEGLGGPAGYLPSSNPKDPAASWLGLEPVDPANFLMRDVAVKASLQKENRIAKEAEDINKYGGMAMDMMTNPSPMGVTPIVGPGKDKFGNTTMNPTSYVNTQLGEGRASGLRYFGTGLSQSELDRAKKVTDTRKDEGKKVIDYYEQRLNEARADNDGDGRPDFSNEEIDKRKKERDSARVNFSGNMNPIGRKSESYYSSRKDAERWADKQYNSAEDFFAAKGARQEYLDRQARIRKENEATAAGVEAGIAHVANMTEAQYAGAFRSTYGDTAADALGRATRMDPSVGRNNENTRIKDEEKKTRETFDRAKNYEGPLGNAAYVGDTLTQAIVGALPQDRARNDSQDMKDINARRDAYREREKLAGNKDFSFENSSNPIFAGMGSAARSATTMYQGTIGAGLNLVGGVGMNSMAGYADAFGNPLLANEFRRKGDEALTAVGSDVGLLGTQASRVAAGQGLAQVKTAGEKLDEQNVKEAGSLGFIVRGSQFARDAAVDAALPLPIPGAGRVRSVAGRLDDMDKAAEKAYQVSQRAYEAAQRSSIASATESTIPKMIQNYVEKLPIPSEATGSIGSMGRLSRGEALSRSLKDLREVKVPSLRSDPMDMSKLGKSAKQSQPILDPLQEAAKSAAKPRITAAEYTKRAEEARAAARASKPRVTAEEFMARTKPDATTLPIKRPLPEVIDVTDTKTLRQVQENLASDLADYATPAKRDQFLSEFVEKSTPQSVSVDPKALAEAKKKVAKTIGPVKAPDGMVTSGNKMIFKDAKTKTSVVQHELAHSFQTKTAGMKGDPFGGKKIQLSGLMKQIESFVDDPKGLVAITGGKGYSASQIKKAPYELLSTLMQHMEKVKGNKRAENILKELMKFHGYSKGGLVYANNGAFINANNGTTDDTPAMLTKGEFVINRQATKKHMPLLNAINSGHLNRGGIVNYLANGGIVGPQYLAAGGRSMASISNSNILPELLNKLSNTGMNSSGGASQLAPLSNVVQTLKQTASSAGGVSNNVSIDTANISSSIQDAVTNAIGQFNEYTEQIGANFTEQFGAAQKSLSSSINTFQTATAQFGEHANAIPTSLSANVTQTTSLHHIGLESIKGNMEKNIYDNTSVSSKNIAQDTVMQYDKTVFEGGMNSAAKPSIMGRPS
jgi:TP901 family phage tail tape measure protein